MNEASHPDRDTLELIHSDLVAERDRLRDAQRTVTSQLGPIPASTSVIVGLLAAVATGDGSESDRVLVVGVALAFSVVITALSIRWSGGQPYRELRLQAMQAQEERLGPEADSDPVGWLQRRIDLETGLYEALAGRFNSQRTRLFIVQGLLLAEAIVVVILAVALGALG
jgi:hypothetical protein